MALTAGAAPGSAFAPTQYGDFVFDRLAAESIALQAGIRVIPTDAATLSVPRIKADPAAAWVAEGATITASDPDADSIVATPRKLAALTVASNELIADSSPEVAGMLGETLARALALKLDLGVLEGTGTAPEIRGLKNTSGIQTVSMGTNGATPTNLDPFAQAIGLLQVANANPTAILMHPRGWADLARLKEQTGSERPLLIDAAGAPTGGPQRSIYGVPVFLSSQLSITETQGSSTNCSSAYLIQADQCVLVSRAQVEVEVDSSRLFNSYQSEVRAIGRFDFVVPNPSAVCRVVGIKPTP